MFPSGLGLWWANREGWFPAFVSDGLDVSIHDLVSLEHRPSLIGCALDVRKDVSEMRSQVSDLANIIGLFGDGRHALQGPGVVTDPVVAIHAESFKHLVAVIHRRSLLPPLRGTSAPGCPRVLKCRLSSSLG
jgi:hypothetical protein